MAQLLPMREITFAEGSAIVDGIKTEGIVNRRQILVKRNPAAAAEQFSTIQSKPQEELRELFKHKIVYVYHDVIDARGDKSSSEDRTFLAVDETIDELGKFIKLLHVTYNVARVIVTADHGFLYKTGQLRKKTKKPVQMVK